MAHAGSVGLRLLADRTGLTAELAKAMSRANFVPGHDRGQVLTDVAVMLADGGEAIADIDVLRHQSSVLGSVASPPTVWRTLDEVTPGRSRKIATARARVRRHVWAHLPDGVPASTVAGTDLGTTILLDVDATIVIAHSEKEQASPTFKRTFGFHPIGVWCDNTSEFLTAKLRTGRAGSNTFLLSQSLMPVFCDLLLGYVLYRAALVPRILPLIAFIGAPLLLASDIAIFFGVYTNLSPLALFAGLPVAAFELSLGIWLIAKGFKPGKNLTDLAVGLRARGV